VLVARVFVRIARTDARTGYFCAVPGGVIVMAVLAQRYGVSVATVTLAQTARLVLVVALFPPILALVAPHTDAGAFVAARQPVTALGLAAMLGAGTVVAFGVRRLGLANPWMLGPCTMAIALAAFGRLPSGVPGILVDAAQVAMGATLGARLTRDFLLGSRRLAVAAVVAALALSVLLTAVAVPLGLLTGLPPAATVLGMAPGGMPEMAVTAKALDLAVPLVLAFHLTRTVMSNLLVGLVWRAALALGLAR
jgi:membrane AbrB-like protein